VNEGSIRSLLDSRGVVDFAKMIAWNPETRLRNVFAKALHKDHVRNAELSPPAPEHIASLLSLGEKCIVVVRDKKQRLLCISTSQFFAMARAKAAPRCIIGTHFRQVRGFRRFRVPRTWSESGAGA
jgi:hypothetical protein